MPLSLAIGKQKIPRSDSRQPTDSNPQKCFRRNKSKPTESTAQHSTVQRSTNMAAPSAKAAKAATQRLGNSGKFFFGSLCVGTFGLGCWQLERLLEKWDAIEDREEQLGLEPIRYDSGFGGSRIGGSTIGNNVLVGDAGAHQHQQRTDASPYRRRLLCGKLHHDKEVLIGPRGAPPGVRMPVSGLSAKSGSSKTATASGMQPGPQGFYVLTPMEVFGSSSSSSDDTTRRTVWINRGWVPKTLVPGADRPHYKNDPLQKAKLDRALRERPPAWNRPEGVVELTAIVSKPESECKEKRISRVGSFRIVVSAMPSHPSGCVHPSTHPFPHGSNGVGDMDGSFANRSSRFLPRALLQNALVRV